MTSSFYTEVPSGYVRDPQTGSLRDAPLTLEGAEKILASYKKERIAHPSVAFSYRNSRLIEAFQAAYSGDQLEAKKQEVLAASQRAHRVSAAIILGIFQKTNLERTPASGKETLQSYSFPETMIHDQFIGNYGRPLAGNCTGVSGSIENEIITQLKEGGITGEKLESLTQQVRAASQRANKRAAPLNQKKGLRFKGDAEALRQQFLAGNDPSVTLLEPPKQLSSSAFSVLPSQPGTPNKGAVGMKKTL